MTPVELFPPSNQLLAALPPEITAALQSRIEAVELAAGTLLYEAGHVLGHVYFPVTAVVSLVSPLQDGTGSEVAVVGREGIVGTADEQDLSDLRGARAQRVAYEIADTLVKTRFQVLGNSSGALGVVIVG